MPCTHCHGRVVRCWDDLACVNCGRSPEPVWIPTPEEFAELEKRSLATMARELLTS